MAEVHLRNVAKEYAGVEVVHGIDLEIADEEFVALVGPSGCGKSTTLRMIAGLEEISSGEILIGGTVVNDLAPKDRDIAMVFQSYALYPHMTVAENMSFALRQQNASKADIAARVNEAARILNIVDLLERKPRHLSGGQRQRVAMGRAIVRKPRVFLFDEPLSNLDARLRVQMRTEIKKLRKKVRATTVYVTHDQVEALTLADRVVVMNKGRIEQIGTPHALYHAPKTQFVAGFIGSPSMNFIPAQIAEEDGRLSVHLAGDLIFAIPDRLGLRYRGLAGRGDLLLGLRPEHVADAGRYLEDGFAAFEARIDVTEPVGMETFAYFTIGDTELCGRVNPGAGARDGQPLRLAADLNNMHVIDGRTGAVL
ncbi:MAG: sn-glycerol-3-phosphate ABC transporter ATP-binding protein UgpC [Betaproteobacteria bacterium]